MTERSSDHCGDDSPQPGEHHNQRLVDICTIRKPHGVRGAVAIACSPDHVEFLRTRPTVTLTRPDGSVDRTVKVVEIAGHPGRLVVRFDGVGDREDALELSGLVLCTPRSSLPSLDEDEYYHADLVGCAVVVDRAGEEILTTVGTIREVLALPANDVLVIDGADGRESLIPFIRDAVPEVDLAARRVTVDPAFQASPDG